ncbi:MAG: hypothetical protein HQL95_04410, partial [Magnetococcales bacterium]|nr:hypothetical protein [Magnetococcales bacterium]
QQDSLLAGLHELGRMIDARDPEAGKRCAFLAVALAATRLRGSLAVVERAVRDGDFLAARVGLNKVLKVLAVLRPEGTGVQECCRQ